MEIRRNLLGIVVSVLISVILMFFLSVLGGLIAGIISYYVVTKISKEYIEKFSEGYNVFALTVFFSVGILIVFEYLFQQYDVLTMYIVENRVGQADIYEMLVLIVSLLVNIINIPAYFLGSYLGFRFVR